MLELEVPIFNIEEKRLCRTLSRDGKATAKGVQAGMASDLIEKAEELVAIGYSDLEAMEEKVSSRKVGTLKSSGKELRDSDINEGLVGFGQSLKEVTIGGGWSRMKGMRRGGRKNC